MRYMHVRWLRLSLFAVVLLAGACVKVRVNPGIEAIAPGRTTTVVVVRHAEKATDDPVDPSISAIGWARAAALSETLKDAGVGAIYSTQLKRTRQTAEPLAKKLGLTIIERTAATAAADLARDVLASQPGKTVLIVGHSNTVPQIVQAFSGAAIPPIQDSEYDHMFIIVIAAQSGPRLYDVRFGRSSP